MLVAHLEFLLAAAVVLVGMHRYLSQLLLHLMRIRLALPVLLERVIQREAQEALPLLLVSLEALALLATQEPLVMVVVVESAQHPLAGA